jgi:dTDP-4-amino-4,6-dideoxygalactose transaminase
MFRLLSPAGAPVSLSDIARSMLARTRHGKCYEQLEKSIKALSGARHCFFVNSGKTALLLGLKGLKEHAGDTRDEVIVPAYTCFTVPAAVARAGLKVRPMDIDPRTMDFRYDTLSAVDFNRVLAIVGNNLFGIPSNWAKLDEISREHNVYLIDDAAQAMGLKHGGIPLGSFGRFGFYSLGRGKNLTAYAGGILVTDDDRLAEALSREIAKLPVGGIGFEMMLLLKTILLSLFLRPRLYWLPSMMPFLGLGETIFDPEFEISRLSRWQVCLSAKVSKHLDSYNEGRRANAGALAERIQALDGFDIPGYDGNNIYAYLRLPVLTADRQTRDEIVASLRRHGITASTMYPATVRNIDGIRPYLASEDNNFTGAQTVVERLVTLPTHPYLRKSDIERIVTTLAGLSQGEKCPV